MGIEGTDTPAPPPEKPERIDLSSVRSIEPVHSDAGDDAVGNDQSRIDLSSVRSIEPVHGGAGDDAVGNDQSRVELPKSAQGTREGAGASDVGDPASPSKDAPGPSAETEVGGETLGSSDISPLSGPDAPPNPAIPDQEQAPTVTQFHDRMAAMAEQGPGRDSPLPPQPEIAEAQAGIKEGVKVAVKAAEAGNTIIDTAKNAVEVAGVAGAVISFAVNKAAEYSTELRHLVENIRL